jgi:uncharacterized YccA/Bax inhibitor family protein
MRTANPALNSDTFDDPTGFYRDLPADAAGVMTIQGTVVKTAFLLLIALGTAGFTWFKVVASGGRNPGEVFPWVLGGAIVSVIASLIMIFKPVASPLLAPVYAAAEGLLLGAISAFFETQYPGIVVQAVGCTFGTLAALLMAYQSGLIRVTENFRLGVVAAMGGISLVYLISFIGSFFGFSIPYIHSSGLIGIGFSVFVVVVAALNLVMDFDYIEHAAGRRFPKYVEWYCAFALMVTLVWLYIEFLRLLSKLSDRR